MLVDIRVNIKILPIVVIIFQFEDYQLRKHSQQSYLDKLNNKCDKLVNIDLLTRKGKNYTESTVSSFTIGNFYSRKGVSIL